MSISTYFKATAMPKLALGWQMNAISRYVGATSLAQFNNAVSDAQAVFNAIGLTSNVISSHINDEAAMRALQKRAAPFARKSFDKRLRSIAELDNAALALWNIRVDLGELRNTYVEQEIVSSDVVKLFEGVNGKPVRLSKKHYVDEYRGYKRKWSMWFGGTMALGIVTTYVGAAIRSYLGLPYVPNIAWGLCNVMLLINTVGICRIGGGSNFSINKVPKIPY